MEELIFDRTFADVTANNDKGNYNASDLNRVESWCEYLKNMLIENGYYVDIQTKTDWKIGFGENMQSNIDRIKNNVDKLKNAFYVLKTTPTIEKNKTSLNYIDANNIEKVLFDIDYLIKKMEESFRYSNTFYSGTDFYLPYNIIL